MAAHGGFPVRTLPRETPVEADRRATYTLACERDACAVVVDLPDLRGMLPLGEAGPRPLTVVIDYRGGMLPGAHIIVNESLLADARLYPEATGSSLLLGPRYFILDESYNRISPRGVTGPVRNILSTMGGSDPAGLTLRTAKFFAGSGLEYDLTIVLGPGFEGKDAVATSLQAYKGRHHLIETPPTLAELVAEADLVIAAAGRTAYEAAFMGVPGILIPSIEHEVLVAEAFSREGAFLALPISWRMPQEEFDARLGQALARLSGDTSLREGMSRRGRELVEGQGRDRVVRAILGALLERSGPTGRSMGAEILSEGK